MLVVFPPFLTDVDAQAWSRSGLLPELIGPEGRIIIARERHQAGGLVVTIPFPRLAARHGRIALPPFSFSHAF